jgi:hypothetical protein
MKRAVLLLALFGLAACETFPTPQPSAKDEFAWSTASGRNAIAGQAKVSRYGRSWTCAGQAVGLMPETASTRTRMQNLYGSTQHAVRTVSEVKGRSPGDGRDPTPFVRSTRCDAAGRFAFHDLPSGGWFVISRVLPSGSSDASRALVVMERVTTRGGQTRAVTLGG